MTAVTIFSELPLWTAAYGAVLAAELAYCWRRLGFRLSLFACLCGGLWLFYGIGYLLSQTYYTDYGFYARLSQAGAFVTVQRRVLISLILMWAGLSIGHELAKLVFRIPALRDLDARPRELDPATLGTHAKLWLVVGIALAGYLLFELWRLNAFQLVSNYLAMDTAEGKYELRRQPRPDHLYFYMINLGFMAPFCSFVLLYIGWRSRRSTYLLAGFGIAVVVLIGRFTSLQKIDWVVWLVQIALFALFIRSGKLTLAGIGLVAGVYAAAAAISAKLAYPHLSLRVLLFDIFDRSIKINNEVVSMAFYVYPDILPHTMGLNVSLIARLLTGGGIVSAHHRMADVLGYPGSTLDPMFIGDAWVDFGFAGVLVVAALLGGAVTLIDQWTRRLGPPAIAAALFGACLYGVYQALITSAQTAMLSGGLVSLPLAVYLISALIAWPGRQKARSPRKD